jgi:hypothetical protein
MMENSKWSSLLYVDLGAKNLLHREYCFLQQRRVLLIQILSLELKWLADLLCPHIFTLAPLNNKTLYELGHARVLVGDGV